MRVPLVLCAVAVVLAACDGPTDPATSPTLASEASLRAHIDLREERAALASAADALSEAIAANGVAAGLTAASPMMPSFSRPAPTWWSARPRSPHS
jgi:hypothetical protein